MSTSFRDENGVLWFRGPRPGATSSTACDRCGSGEHLLEECPS